MMTLDLAIATYKPEGIARVAAMLLPPMEGVRYVVSWQAHENAPVPPVLLRPDVAIHRFDGKGLSNNRNNALGHCTAQIILFADDDVSFSADAFENIIHTFENNPAVDVATFQVELDYPKTYPDKTIRLDKKLPKDYSVCSIEIALRRSTSGDLRCCPELGVSSPRLNSGEDEIFLLTAIRRGLNCCFFPITICSHHHPSTGSQTKMSNNNLRGQGCASTLMYPKTAVLRIPLKAWRVWRKGQASLPRALWYLTAGALAAPGVYRRNRKYLW